MSPHPIRRQNLSQDDDDDGDGWVHGGRYVPSQRSTHKKSLLANNYDSSATPAATTRLAAPEAQPSPWGMISPAPLEPLNTPMHADRNWGDGNDNTTPMTTAAVSMRTPFTTQLARLLQPTPKTTPRTSSTSNAPFTPDTITQHGATSHGNDAHKNDGTSNGHAIQTETNHPVNTVNNNDTGTSMEKMLLQTIFILTTISTTISTCWSTSPLPSFFSQLAQRIRSNARTNSRNASSTFGSICVLLESFMEFVSGVHHIVFPYFLWAAETLVALVITIGGTLVLGIMMVVFGKEYVTGVTHEIVHSGNNNANNGSVDGEKENVAMRILRESIENSPFVKRRQDGEMARVPFSFSSSGGNGSRGGVSDKSKSTSPESLRERLASINGGVVSSHGIQPTAQTKLTSPPASVSATTASATTKSTPPASAMRNRTSITNVKATPRTNIIDSNSKQTPQTANIYTRRVLFSETAHGEVSTEQFHYDKHLPASARKVARVVVRDDVSGRFGTPQKSEVRETSVNSPSLLGSASSATSTPENKILRPSTYSLQKKEHEVSSSSSAPDSSERRGQRQDEEKKKQQYIEQNGLLSAITPLSRRYGKLKRQQQPLGITNGLAPRSTNATSNAISATNNSARDAILKRKRQDLLSAASRLGRHRRARVGGATSSLPVRVLGRNHTPSKRPRETESDRTDEWVWRAMNNSGDKENIGNQGASAKRGKYSNGYLNESRSNSTSSAFTPSKAATPSMMTPPKMGTSTFGFGSSTPAPKKANEESTLFAGSTPGKSSASFSFGDTPASLSKDKSTTVTLNAASVTANAGNSTGFAFGPDTARDASSISFGADVKPDVTTVPVIPFVGSASSSTFAPSAPPSTAEETKPAVGSAAPFAPLAGGSFSFGSGTTGQAPETKTESSFSFGGVSTSTTSKPVELSASATSFSFGDSNHTAAPNTTAPAPTAAGISFGGASVSKSLSQPSSSSTTPGATAGFSFGSNSTSIAAPAATATTPATSAFSFGGNPTASTPATSASGFEFDSTAVPPAATGTSSFSFGAGPASTAGASPAVPNFAAPIAGGVASSGGASARRRAKASGRRK